MAQRGRSAREMQEELERARRRADRGRGPGLPPIRPLARAFFWLALGIVVAVVMIPLLPDPAYQMVANVQRQVIEIRDALAGTQ